MFWAITAPNYHFLFCRQHHHQNFCQHQIQVRRRGERQIARNTALEWQVQCTCDRYTHDSVITIYVIYMIHIFTINALQCSGSARLQSATPLGFSMSMLFASSSQRYLVLLVQRYAPIYIFALARENIIYLHFRPEFTPSLVRLGKVTI